MVLILALLASCSNKNLHRDKSEGGRIAKNRVDLKAIVDKKIVEGSEQEHLKEIDDAIKEYELSTDGDIVKMIKLLKARKNAIEIKIKK